MQSPQAHDGQRIHCLALGPDRVLYTGGSDQVRGAGRAPPGAPWSAARAAPAGPAGLGGPAVVFWGGVAKCAVVVQWAMALEVPERTPASRGVRQRVSRLPIRANVAQCRGRAEGSVGPAQHPLTAPFTPALPPSLPTMCAAAAPLEPSAAGACSGAAVLPQPFGALRDTAPEACLVRAEPPVPKGLSHMHVPSAPAHSKASRRARRGP